MLILQALHVSAVHLCSPDHMLYKTAFAVDLLNISSLQQTVSTHQGQTDNCIGWNVKFNLETNPYRFKWSQSQSQFDSRSLLI